MRRLQLLCHAFFIIFLFSTLALAQDLPARAPAELIGVSVGTGFKFESGQYGTNHTSESWRIPLLIQWAPNNRWGLSLEIPYVHLNNAENTILLGGRSSPMGQGKGRMDGSGNVNTSSSDNAEKGLGDTTLYADLTLVSEADYSPRILGLLYGKLPTGDKQKGLGTGEFDWGAGLGMSKTWGAWSSYTEALYILPGTSQTYDPAAYWEWMTSLSYRAGSKLRPSLALNGGTAAFPDNDTPLEIKAGLSILTGSHHSVSLSIIRGLSDASPEWSGGLFVFFDY